MCKDNIWHNAKSDPPTEDGEYLCCYKSWNDKPKRIVCKYACRLSDIYRYNFENVDRGGWFIYGDEWGYFEATDITHWCELPGLPNDYIEKGGAGNELY